MRFQFIRLGLLYALLAVSSVAQASSTCTDERFQKHSKQALEAYNRGDYDVAVAHYDKAYQCQRKPIVLFNLGQAARKAKRYREALTYFRRYLEDEPNPNAAIREELEQHIGQLDRMVREAEQLRQMADNDGRPAAREARPAGSEAVAPQPLVTPLPPMAPLPLPAPKDALTPIYKRPWFWAAVGGGAVAIAVITGVSIWAAQQPRFPAEYGTPRVISSGITLSFGGSR